MTRRAAIGLLVLAACATPQRRLRDEFGVDVWAMKLNADLVPLIDTTEYDETTLSAIGCGLGSCGHCFRGMLDAATALPRDLAILRKYSAHCAADTTCELSNGPERVRLALQLAPKDPIGACELFRDGERDAVCRVQKGSPDANLEASLREFIHDFQRACVQADAFAADPDVIAAKKAGDREVLNRKRAEYRSR